MGCAARTEKASCARQQREGHAPSAVSLSDGGSRRAALKPITNGATVMTPMTSDANQWCQIRQADALEWWKNR